MILNEEQQMLRDSAQAWARDNAPVRAYRQMRDRGEPLGFDRKLYAQIAELGWTAIAIPEEHGGMNMGYVSVGLILEELGKTLTASPLLSSTVGASAIVLGGSKEQQTQWLPRIAAGSAIVTLAIEEGPRHAPDQVAVQARREGKQWVLSGTKRHVAEGMAADAFIVSSITTDGRIALFLVPATTVGVTRTAQQTMDARGHASVQFVDVKLGDDAELRGMPNKLLDAVLDRARIALAAEMLGMATQAFTTTVEFLKVRVQFGQPIGSFQALQHRAAEMFTDLELTRSVVEAALVAVDTQSAELPLMASLAKLRAGETLKLISNEMVQMHGGIGMTDEHDAGLYLKRARVADATFGNTGFHRERFGRLSGS